MTLYGYARVSTLEQIENLSISSQKEKLINFGVLEKNIIVDSFTGTTTDRRFLENLKQ